MSKGRIKVGIYAISLLMMGVIFVSGALSTIGAHFPNVSQTMVQNIISIPCLVVIPVTLVIGKLMDRVSKKTLAIVGAILFLIGGAGPMLVDNFTLILVLRGIFGVAIGIVQTVPSALAAENFEGKELDSVQGNITAAQMLGATVMIFAGGQLAEVRWNLTFIVHLIAVVSLILALICIPGGKPGSSVKTEAGGQKAKLTSKAWIWAAVMLLMFVGIQVFSVSIAYLVTEKGIGAAAQSGTAVSIQCIAGIIMGLVYGKLAGKARKLTLSIGLLGLAAAYVLIASASSIIMVYVGAFVFGLALSICMPCVIVESANSVPVAASGMAISLTMCGQNLGQFICPYLVNPVAAALGGNMPNRMAYYMAAVYLAVFTVIAVIWGLSKNRQESRA